MPLMADGSLQATPAMTRRVAAPWFVDGLDDAEAISMTALYEAARQDPERFTELLEAGAAPTS